MAGHIGPIAEPSPVPEAVRWAATHIGLRLLRTPGIAPQRRGIRSKHDKPGTVALPSILRMALEYRRPPLVEALCELRFASSADRKWDWTIPEMLYEQIRDNFPVRKEHYDIEISIPSTGPMGAPTRAKRMQFLTSAGNMMVQVAPDLLAVNSVGSHLGWADLRDTLLGVLERYGDIARPPALAMAAVRYINKVEVLLRPGVALEQYFTVLPILPEGVPREVSTFLMHTEVGYSDPDALFRFRFGSTASPGQQEGVAAFLLDYEHVGHGDRAPSFNGLRAWLDAGHARIEQAFYGSFTPMTHAEVFQEVRS